MTTLDLVAESISVRFWQHGLMVDQRSMDRMALRVYLANQSRIIASHARSERRSYWLLQKTFLLVAGALPPSLFHFYLMAAANASPSLTYHELREIIATVHVLRSDMHHTPEAVVDLIQAGFSYQKENACTPRDAGNDESYVTEYANSLARTWF